MIAVELRHELMPPELDDAEVARLAKLAAQIDGANPGQWEDELAEFNRAVGVSFAIADFQGIYGAEEHETWVRRVLVRERVRPVPDVTRAELLEIVRRGMPSNGNPQHEAIMAIIDANLPLADASYLSFYPLDYDAATNTWGGGRQMCDYDPTADQIVNWAMGSGRRLM